MFRKVGIFIFLLLMLSGCGNIHKQDENLPANYEVFVLDENWTFKSRYKANAVEDVTERTARILLLSGEWVTVSGFYIEIVPTNYQSEIGY